MSCQGSFLHGRAHLAHPVCGPWSAPVVTVLLWWSSHRRGSSRSPRRGVRDWIAPWVWGQKDQDNWWLQDTLFRIYWILYGRKRNSLLDSEPIELLIVSVHSPPWTSTSLQDHPWTLSSPNQAHTQPPAIRNNQDSQFPEVSWPEIALLISFTSLRPGTKSAFQVKDKGFAFCERHTVSSRSYLRLRLHASHILS